MTSSRVTRREMRRRKFTCCPKTKSAPERSCARSWKVKRRNSIRYAAQKQRRAGAEPYYKQSRSDSCVELLPHEVVFPIVDVSSKGNNRIWVGNVFHFVFAGCTREIVAEGMSDDGNF